MSDSAVSPRADTALLTDLYQLTMAHAYLELGMHETAVFELFVRRLPAQRAFLVAAGLEHALQHIETLRFRSEDLEYLERLGSFPRSFLDHLAGVRFTGSVHAMPEGTVFFANQPILRITAPILEAQILESRLINILHFESLIASKAARCVLAAGGRRLIDFGMRRAHGAEAALYAARSAWIAGFDATATVEAGRRFGIPVSGTMAHSFVQAHASEEHALRGFLWARPEPTTLLIDTYDTERAAHKVVALARELAARGEPRRIAAVRIDSGDLAMLSHSVRAVLDAGGCGDIRIVASGGLDEYRIAELLANRAPIDAFGVGTSMNISADAPSLDVAYKLEEYAGTPRRKRSAGKATWPGCKQVLRTRDAAGRLAGDRVVLEGEAADAAAGAEPLLSEVMRGGHRTAVLPELAAIREHCRAQLTALPASLRTLDGGAVYPVVLSEPLQELAAELDAAQQ